MYQQHSDLYDCEWWNNNVLEKMAGIRLKNNRMDKKARRHLSFKQIRLQEVQKIFY